MISWLKKTFKIIVLLFSVARYAYRKKLPFEMWQQKETVDYLCFVIYRAINIKSFRKLRLTEEKAREDLVKLFKGQKNDL